MNSLQLYLLTITNLYKLIGNPYFQRDVGKVAALGRVNYLLGIVSETLERGEEGHEDLEIFANQIAKMSGEKRPPTSREWGKLRWLSDAAHAAIQKAAEDAKGEVGAGNGDNLEEHDQTALAGPEKTPEQ